MSNSTNKLYIYASPTLRQAIYVEDSRVYIEYEQRNVDLDRMDMYATDAPILYKDEFEVEYVAGAFLEIKDLPEIIKFLQTVYAMSKF